MQWHDPNSVAKAINKCDEVWESIDPSKRGQCLGLLFYNELLHVFYRLRICDYKNASQHVDRLDAAMKADMQRMQEKQRLANELDSVNKNLSQPNLPPRERATLSRRYARLQERLQSFDQSSSNGRESLEAAYFGNTKRALEDKLVLAPPPIDGSGYQKVLSMH
jgi:MAternally-affected-uncoordination protein